MLDGRSISVVELSIHNSHGSSFTIHWAQPLLTFSLHSIFILIFLLSLCFPACRRFTTSAAISSKWRYIFYRSLPILVASTGALHLIAALLLLTAPLQRWGVLIIQGIAWMILSFTLVFNSATRSFAMLTHTWWVLTFFLQTYAAILSGIDLFNGMTLSPERILALLSWPISCMLLACSFKTEPTRASPTLSEPLLHKQHHQPNSNVTPFQTAATFSRLTFTWLNPLFALGYNQPLKLSDVPSVCEEDEAKTAYSAFLTAWERQKTHGSSSSLALPLFWALASCNWKQCLISGIFALLKTLLLSAGPLLLNSFINFAKGVELFNYEGYTLVAALLFAKLLESLSQRQWNFRTRRIGLRIRASLVAAMYYKQLRLSNIGRQKHAAGEIVNYMSVDAYRIGEFPFSMHQLWTTPLQVLVAVGILFYSVGLATVAGIVVIVLTMLANSPLAKLQQRFQTRLMQAQDERLRTTTEALQNMKVLKLQAWEEEFKSSIHRLREVEHKWLSAVQYRKTLNTLVFWISPVLVSTATFAACYFNRIPLTATNVFTSLATLRLVQDPIRSTPDLIAVVIQARVSLARIAKFLLDDEIPQDVVKWNPDPTSEDAVNIQDASVSWDPSFLQPTLKSISMKVKHGQRLAVCGEVGAGKSTFLSAILGEVPKVAGLLEVSGSIAYVAQTAWIQSGTIQDNVLFGQPMDEKRYKEVLRACALDKDVESFPFRDLTEIGERGINMSGGQKQRIQLARAVYQDADIYLLDDPFSAVDANTATRLFKDCIMGALSDKTVILVTHQVEFLPVFDCILLMQDGKIHEAGQYYELLQPGSAFEELVKAHLETMGEKDASCNIEVLESDDSSKLKKHCSMIKSLENDRHEMHDQLTKEEEKDTGDTGIKPILDYLGQNKGYIYFVFACLSQALFVVGQVSSNTWLAAKIDDIEIGPAMLLIVYSSIGITSIMFLASRAFIVVTMGLTSSRSFFSNLMTSIFHAPMAFFDSTPTGRIMSRVSADLNLIDLDFPFMLIFTVASSLNAISNLVVSAVVTWQALIIILPMICLSWWLRHYYFATAKELMRYSGITKSPIANFFAESISGATTIRAFKSEHFFMEKNLSMIDNNSSPSFHAFAANEWMIQRLEALSATVLCSSALIMILLPAGTVDPGFVGLALSYGLSLSNSIVFSMQNQCLLASYSVSVERVKQYMNITSEAPYVLENNRPSSSWPCRGKVELQDLQVRYRPKSPLVLHGISCTFEGGQRVGVVGRTGSGKTTLISALFRLVEPVGGRIVIDGLDIKTIGLHDLRSRLSIIPQEPILFRGTIRFNLDPLSKYSDNDIWKVLDKCQLGNLIRGKTEKLDAPVGDDGANWSVGQRQLFCLGRALLKRSVILVLDEATASIDNATDATLQKTIREEFRGCTVITVAHRIPTVIDSDMVLALSDGSLVEFDKPAKLLEQETSLFSKLVTEYWTRSRNAVGGS